MPIYNASNTPKMVRVIYERTHGVQWTKAIISLYEHQIARPVHILADGSQIKSLQEYFPDCPVQNYVFARRGIPHKQFQQFDQAPFTEVCQELFMAHGCQYLDQASRYSKFGGMSIQEGQFLLYRHLTYWNAVLLETKPDLVVFYNPPHLLYNLVIFWLCKKLGIATFMVTSPTTYGLLGSLYTTDHATAPVLDDTFQVCSVEKAQDLANHLKEKITKGYDKVFGTIEATSINRVTSHVRGDILLWLKIVFCSFCADLARLLTLRPPKSLFWNGFQERGIAFDKSFKASRFSRTKDAWYELCEKRYRLQVLEKYMEHSRQPDAREQYIYFPLPAQPEATINPSGADFHFVMSLANVLAHSLPDGWRLYIKEHPAQFSSNESKTFFRQEWFYRSLAELPNVTLVSLDCPVTKLIDNAKAIACLCNSTGIEALVRGKPVLVFGHAWYKHAPGSLACHDLESTRQALGRVAKGFTVNRNDFDNWLVKAFQHDTPIRNEEDVNLSSSDNIYAHNIEQGIRQRVREIQKQPVGLLQSDTL